MGEDGDWEAPMKDNPDFKGEWSVKQISNPDYKGIWEAKKIANPDFVDDDGVYKYEDFSFIGFDLWQVKGGTIFDNIIITDDVAEADAFVAKWKALSKLRSRRRRRLMRRRLLQPRRPRRQMSMTTMMMMRTRRRPRKRCEQLFLSSSWQCETTSSGTDSTDVSDKK